MLIKFIRITLFLSFVIFSVSCDKNDLSENAARLRIKLTESPLQMQTDETFVLREIRLHIQSVEVSVSETDEWTALKFSDADYDVLPLSNGKMLQIIDQFFPANQTIHSLKITLGGNNRLVTPGRDINLVLPPESREIIVRNVNENLYANIISSLVINVMPTVSVENQNYFLTPRVRIFSEIFGGSLRGYVAPTDISSVVSVSKDEEVLFSIPEADGMFLFPGLAEGEWNISIYPHKDSGFKDTTFVDTVRYRKITDIKPKPIRLREAPTGTGTETGT